MKEKTSRYSLWIDGKSYVVIENIRKRKGMSLRLSQKEADTFLLSVGYRYASSRNLIDSFLISSAPKILARSSRPKYYEDGQLFILGHKEEVGEKSEEEISALLKRAALPYFEKRAAYWKEVMGVKDSFAVRIRDMKTRFGSNCFQTHRVVFTTRAICYPPEIIDYLIIHELAHFFHKDHQAHFHALIAKYDPEWKKHQRQLQKGIYDGNSL